MLLPILPRPMNPIRMSWRLRLSGKWRTDQGALRPAPAGTPARAGIRLSLLGAYHNAVSRPTGRRCRLTRLDSLRQLDSLHQVQTPSDVLRPMQTTHEWNVLLAPRLASGARYGPAGPRLAESLRVLQ